MSLCTRQDFARVEGEGTVGPVGQRKDRGRIDERRHREKDRLGIYNVK